MTQEQCSKIMAVLETAYSRYYANKTSDERKNAVIVWHNSLKDFEYSTVGIAVQILINTSKYPPSIAEVIDKTLEISATDDLSEMEAWERVLKAISNSTYNAAEEFEKLPEIVKTTIGNSSILKEWGKIGASELNTVVHSNFLKSFREAKRKHKEMQSLPKDIVKFIESKKQLSSSNAGAIEGGNSEN